MRKCSALLLLFALLGASPTVTQSASGASVSSLTSVTFGALPTAGNEFVAVVFDPLSATAPTLSGTWSTGCTRAGTASFYGVFYRAVVSGDTGSTTVAIVTSTNTKELIVYQVAGFSALDGCGAVTGSSGLAMTPSATPTVSGDLGLSTGVDYITGAGLAAITWTNTAGYTILQTPGGGSTSVRIGGSGASKGPLTSAAQTGNVLATEGGTITTDVAYAAMALLAGGGCASVRMLRGLGC